MTSIDAEATPIGGTPVTASVKGIGTIASAVHPPPRHGNDDDDDDDEEDDDDELPSPVISTSTTKTVAPPPAPVSSGSAPATATTPAGPPTAVEFEPPLACVRRILKKTLPSSTNVGKDASAAFARASGIFIIYITACANDFARENRRQTITANDVLAAIKELDFDEFTPELMEFLEAYRTAEKGKRDAKAAAAAAKASDGGGVKKKRKLNGNEEEEDDDEEDEDEEEEDGGAGGGGEGSVAGNERPSKHLSTPSSAKSARSVATSVRSKDDDDEEDDDDDDEGEEEQEDVGNRGVDVSMDKADEGFDTNRGDDDLDEDEAD